MQPFFTNSCRCLFLICMLFLGCGKKQELIHPSLEKITSSVYASGTIMSSGQYQVFSKVNGLVEKILVKEGDEVKSGQPLLILSNKSQTLNYENAKLLANYSSAAQNQEKLAQAQNELEVAKLKMENDVSLLDRQQKLWNNEIGTKNDVDQRILSLKNSSSQYNASKLKSNDLKKQINLQSEQTQKSASIASSSLNDYTIKSEIDGRLYNLNKVVGEMVNTQSPVAIIGNANQFYIELQVDEYDIAKIQRGQKVFVSMDSYKGQAFEAAIEKIYPLMNQKSKSFKVDAVFINQPKNLFPNLSAQANIVIAVKEKAIIIPRNYLVDNEYVYLENKEKRKVKIGLMDYEKVEILAGITTKDALIKSIQ
jgi:HlyD family secretion protein